MTKRNPNWTKDEFELLLMSDHLTDEELALKLPLRTSGAVAAVARVALELSHFDLAGNDQRPPEDEKKGCARACYDCLLSYYNQRDHFMLNRHQVRDFLLELTASLTHVGSAERDHEGHYRYPYGQTDPESDLEREFLTYLYENGYRVIVYRYDSDLDPLLSNYEDVFGTVLEEKAWILA